MNDVEELKKYVLVHARAQGIPAARYTEVLRQVHVDDGDAAGSWVGEWTRQAESLERAGKIVDASRCYAMARFPFVDGPARERAAARSAELFDRWRIQQRIEPLDVEVNGGRFRCWTSGLSREKPLPVLLIMGGIVTPKEQWGPVLAALGRFGMAGVVAEMPGVGENTVAYDSKSWRMISAILDEIEPVANTSLTYGMTLSFSGHLALRCATEDPRIRGVVTAGAPISRFFTDHAWQAGLPSITVDTLCHLMDVDRGSLSGRLPELALSPEQLDGLGLPVHYLASTRDEIIPPEELTELKTLRYLHLVENDDVHGSPSHTTQTRLWSVLSVLRMRGIRSGRTALLSGLLRLSRLRSAS
ncbi:alpha/beta hydrolase [Lentzea kentuckyensis]|uniref:alpha/beta hydrolase n=1 Tax=Lentzea kentuckyensis TaxID=360086 RepID=UPI000A3AC1E7|nr:alpha/beta hydrolase [Lentzea kentuckyensis]